MFGSSIAHYKKGTKNWFSSLTGWVKDKWDGIVNFIKHPIKSLKGIMSNAMGKIKGSEFITKFTPPMKTGFVNSIWKQFKQMLQDLKTAHDDVGGDFDGKMGKHGVYDYLWKVAKKTMAHFGNMHVSSGYRPGDRFYHGKHQAIDIALPASQNGSSKYRKIGDWVFDKFKKQVAYVITLNRVKDRKGLSGTGVHSNWTNWAEGGHMDHLHINGMWGPNDIGKVGSGVGNLRSKVKQALQANHLSTSNAMIRKVLRQIQTESGGRANARQPGADPDGDGSGPALGLMQTKRSTFNANKFKGHGNIFNAYDNLLAALRYAKKRYGKSLSFLGHGHGYANGGIINTHQLAEIGEGNQPEAIIPLSRLKRAQATQVLDQVRQRFTSEDGTGQNYDKELEAQIKELTDTVSSLKDLVAMILNVNSSTLQATKDGAFDKTKQYQQQARDMSLASYQGF